MAEFSRLVITNKGQALLAKMMTGEGNVEFTKISTSDMEYTLEQLEALTEFSGVKQTVSVSKVTRTNGVAVTIEATFDNTELTQGYHMRALGLYAIDPDDGEILYAVTAEVSGCCYMPAYNGVTVSGACIKLVTTVGNAENVSLEVDPGVYATVGEIKELRESVDGIETWKDNTQKRLDNWGPTIVGHGQVINSLRDDVGGLKDKSNDYLKNTGGTVEGKLNVDAGKKGKDHEIKISPNKIDFMKTDATYDEEGNQLTSGDAMIKIVRKDDTSDKKYYGEIVIEKDVNIKTKGKNIDITNNPVINVHSAEITGSRPTYKSASDLEVIPLTKFELISRKIRLISSDVTDLSQVNKDDNNLSKILINNDTVRIGRFFNENDIYTYKNTAFIAVVNDISNDAFTNPYNNSVRIQTNDLRIGNSDNDFIECSNRTDDSYYTAIKGGLCSHLVDMGDGIDNVHGLAKIEIKSDIKEKKDFINHYADYYIYHNHAAIPVFEIQNNGYIRAKGLSPYGDTFRVIMDSRTGEGLTFNSNAVVSNVPRGINLGSLSNPFNTIYLSGGFTPDNINFTNLSLDPDGMTVVCPGLPGFEITVKDNYKNVGGILLTNDAMMPHGSSTQTLGSSYCKWKEIYAVNGTIQTSDKNEKRNIKDLSIEKAQRLIYGLKPSTYQMKVGTSGRTHWGLISQDIENLFEKIGLTSVDFAGFIKSPRIEEVRDKNDKLIEKKEIQGEYIYSLRYDEFIAPIIKVIQSQHEEIETLKQETQILKQQMQQLMNKES